jgi:hypothetical protein
VTKLEVVEAGVAHPLEEFGRYEVSWDNVLGKPDVVDNPLDVPNGDLIFVAQQPKTRIFGVRLSMFCGSEAALNESLRQLASLMWSPGAPTLWRRTIPYDAGDEVSEAYGMYLGGLNPGGNPDLPPGTALLPLQIRMLSAYWHDTTTSAAVAL